LQNPSNQNELVDALASANPHTVVVIESGNPVLMPSKDKVAAIIEAWYPGEAGGREIANVLFGKVDPSGKLPYVSCPGRGYSHPGRYQRHSRIEDGKLDRIRFYSGTVRGLAPIRADLQAQMRADDIPEG
jgi:hypothetical protein